MLMAARFSRTYIAVLKRGPFPGQIDPWAEAKRYFQQIHAGMIEHLVAQINDTLLEMGYVAGRETSLTIAEQRFEPDVYVETRTPSPRKPPQPWNYAAAAALLETAPAVILNLDEPLQDAIFIREMDSSQLVTVVELISPSNKTDPQEIRRYQECRTQLLSEHINVVEIDLTRSNTRLLNHSAVEEYPYHVLIYLPGENPGYIGMEYGERLKRIALPLRGEALPVDLQVAYDAAYQVMSIPVHILNHGDYREEKLPLPTLLNATQRQNALEKVAAWRAELERLHHEKSG